MLQCKINNLTLYRIQPSFFRSYLSRKNIHISWSEQEGTRNVSSRIWEKMKVPARSLLQALVNASEKGAKIARVIRAESALLELLVQEKAGDQKNRRFVQDFKTLADVLVQETVRHDLSAQVKKIYLSELDHKDSCISLFHTCSKFFSSILALPSYFFFDMHIPLFP